LICIRERPVYAVIIKEHMVTTTDVTVAIAVLLRESRNRVVPVDTTKKKES